MPDPWMTLAGISTQTHRISLGTWITPVGRRQPWQVARDLATLDQLSGGRVILGAGLGRRPDYELFGQPWDFKTIAARTDEALTLIDRLWAGEPVDYDGDHYRIGGAVLLPTPVQQPRIPIVIGGLWPRKAAVRRGAKWDGIMTHFPGDGVLPSDGVSPEKHATDMVTLYRSLTDTPREVFLPANPENPSSEWTDLTHDLEATWLYTAKLDNSWTLDTNKISQGPPGN